MSYVLYDKEFHPPIYSLMFTAVKSQGHLSGRRETTFLTSRDEAQDLENMEKGGDALVSRYFQLAV